MAELGQCFSSPKVMQTIFQWLSFVSSMQLAGCISVPPPGNHPGGAGWITTVVMLMAEGWDHGGRGRAVGGGAISCRPRTMVVQDGQ